MQPIAIVPRQKADVSAISASVSRRLRASSYIIFVDLPDDRENMLLVHGYTGAYDLVSQKVATYIRSLEVRHPPRPLYGVWTPAPQVEGEVETPSEQTLAILKRRGYLTEKTVEEEEAFFVKVANYLHQQSLRIPPNYIMMPTYDCNLRCAYCFQDHMRTNPDYRHLLRTMTPEIVDRIFKGMLDIETHHDLPPEDQYVRRIGFFGGEPLLARNRPVIEYIIGKARSLGKVSFWAVTNGTEIDAYRDLLNPAGIQFLQITLDGPPEEHDRRRIYADRTGSFERIARNITMALDQQVRIDVRMNIDRNNIEKLPRLAEEFIARGWDKYPHFSPYTAPIHAANKNVDVRTTFTSWTLDKALDELRLKYPAMHVIRRPDDSLKALAHHLIQSHGQPIPRSQFCGANDTMYVIDPFADVYACWERTGDTRIRIGYIDAEGHYLVDGIYNQLWRTRNVTSNRICRQCSYALNCGGGCAVRAEESRGDANANYCDGYAARFRASVAEAYLEYRANKQTLPPMESFCERL